jgi:hypothetical protein
MASTVGPWRQRTKIHPCANYMSLLLACGRPEPETYMRGRLPTISITMRPCLIPIGPRFVQLSAIGGANRELMAQYVRRES